MARNNLTTILFHRFFFEGESADRSLDRLKRQCEWLSTNFTALSLNGAEDALRLGQLPRRPLLITIDDAKIEILRVASIFEEFDLPIAIFACVGWCAKEEPDEDSLLARLVNEIEWYKGSAQKISDSLGSIVIGTSAAENRKAADLILANREALQPELGAMLAMLQSEHPEQRISCSWSELSDLGASGVAIGGHSVSHINLAEASKSRMQFEISETRRILLTKFGSCNAFAYPYGMNNTFSPATTAQLSADGFHCAFLTHSEFSNADSDLLQLPRISMPDRPMSHQEFCLRAAGAGVVYRKLKRLLPQ